MLKDNNPDTYTLKSEFQALQKELEEKDQKISSLKEKLSWFERQVFGKRSEKVLQNSSEDILFFKGFEPSSQQEEIKKKK